MLKTNFDKVLEFHSIFGHPIRRTANVDCAEKHLRLELIREEINEFDTAYTASNLVEMADALGDIIYVTYGAALTFGLDLDEPTYDVSPEFVGQAHSTFNLLLDDFGSSLVGELEKAIDENDGYQVEVILGTILTSAIGAADVLGIDIDAVVTAIHTSNLSKLGADGKPIYRPDGKVLKGPNYVTPTEAIKQILGV